VREVFTKSRRAYVPIEELKERRIEEADAIGKNILIFVDKFAIRVHLMLFGAIHIYKVGDPLLKPEERVKLKIVGNEKKLVVYNAPIVEVDFADKLVRRLKESLGPDPLREDWSRDEAIERLRGMKGRKIGEVLLDQSVIAVIGNSLRNEILFRAGVHPERRVDRLSEEEIERIVDIAKELCEDFLELKLKREGLKPILYVYNRYSKPCRICGNPIRFYIQEEVKRKTFVCERCQK